MSAQKPPQREFIIRVPKKNEEKRFSILRFNDSLNIDPVNWFSSDVKMAREDNRKEALAGITEQDYGEGSVYGRAAREEARRKKYGRRRNNYEHDKQPWLLTINSNGKERKLRSICEGGAGEFADNWVFLKAGDDFQAHKITSWYQFLPCITHKTLDSEQAEEKFQLRNKVMNQFALKAQIMQELKDQDVERTGSSKSLLIKDEMSTDDDEDVEKNDGDEDSGRKKKPKKKKNLDTDKKRDKRQRVENADEVAAYESEDGQDEGREYDYISDSGSDSDRDEKTAEEKIEEALVAVGDESGLKSLIDGSDLDTSSEEENQEDEDELENEKVEKSKKREKKKTTDGESNKGNNENDPDDNDSSDSDSDDPDNENVNSVFFMQRKDVRKRTADEATDNFAVSNNGSVNIASSSRITDQTIKRQKVEERTTGEMPSTQLAAHAAAEALDEDMVRRLLLRKPHTTKELLNKVKPRCGPMTKAEVVTKLALILKKIEPYQFRQKVDNKEVLYFSLNQTA